MYGNAKLRWFLLAPILLALFVVASSVSLAGELEAAQERVRQNPYDADVHFALGETLFEADKYPEAIVAFNEVLRINPDNAEAHFYLGRSYKMDKHYVQAGD